MAKRLVIIWTIVLGLAVTSYGAVANASCPKVGFTVVEPHATSDTRPLRVGRNQTLFVRQEPITTTGDISEIKLARAAGDGHDDVRIQIKFTPVADQRLHDATTNHSGMRLALLFDDAVLSNVVWEGPYGTYIGGTEVSVPHGMDQARKLMKAIQGCTAPTMGDRTP